MEKIFLVVNYSSFRDVLRIFKIKATDKHDALKKSMRSRLLYDSDTPDEVKDSYIKSEIDFQNSDDCPKTFEEHIEMLWNSDIVIEVKELDELEFG